MVSCVAHILTAAVVLVKNLGVVNSAFKYRGKALVYYLAPSVRGRTNVVSVSLVRAAGYARLRLVSRGVANARKDVFVFDFFLKVVAFNKRASLRIAKAGAIYAEKVTVFV